MLNFETTHPENLKELLKTFENNKPLVFLFVGNKYSYNSFVNNEYVNKWYNATSNLVVDNRKVIREFTFTPNKPKL